MISPPTTEECPAVAAPESPELIRLYNTYTPGPDSIGAKLTRAIAARGRDDPLIAATSTDFALYPGGGRPPTVEGFRIATRGFKELSAISHLGPAVASLVAIRTLLGDGSWQVDAERLLAEVETTRVTNSPKLWQKTIAVGAHRGREEAIADMIDYSCAVTARYLRRALADENYLTPESLRDDYLAGGGAADLPVPVNHVMIATFFLVEMDIGHRLIRWFRGQDIDWERAMVMIAGRHGRPTAGVTWNTSTVATIVLAASGDRLPRERMYVAPHAPTFPTPTDGDLAEVIAVGERLRAIWCRIRASVELGPLMFDGYPKYTPGPVQTPDVTDFGITEVSEMPAIHSPDDMRAMVTRLRVILEDPRQLVSGCVTDYVAAQLTAVDNDPARVVVPGLDGVSYPTIL